MKLTIPFPVPGKKLQKPKIIQNLLSLTAQKRIQPLSEIAKCFHTKSLKSLMRMPYKIKRILLIPILLRKISKPQSLFPIQRLLIYHDYESSNDVTKFLEILGKIKQELKINSFDELTNYLENL